MEIGSQKRQTLKEAGYVFIKDNCNGSVVVLQKEFNSYELWQLNDDYAGYVLDIYGFGYEFVRSLEPGKD